MRRVFNQVPVRRFTKVSRALLVLGSLGSVMAFGASSAVAQCGNAGPSHCSGKTVEKCHGDINRAVDHSARQMFEVQVNTFEHSLQNRACLDVDSQGNIFVLWDSRRQELNSYGVVGQRFDPLGRPLGTEMHINEYLPGSQHEAAVAYDSQDRAWVAWEAGDQDGDSSGIFMRHFGETDGSFGAITGETQVNKTTKGAQADPSIAINDRGEVMVVWVSSTDATTDVTMARIYNAAGEPVTGEIVIGQSENGRDRLASAAGLADGQFVIVWDRVNADGYPVGISARSIDASHNPADSVTSLIVSEGQRYDIEPSIAMDADGNMLMTWMRSTEDHLGYDVVVQRFNSEMKPIDDMKIVSSFKGDWQSGAAVAVAADGRFVVSYNVFGDKPATTSHLRPQTPSTLFAQMFDAKGNAAGDAFVVNQSADGKHAHAAGSNATRVVWSDMGQLAFAWEGHAGDDTKGIGLTISAPNTLDIPAPPIVERVAAGHDLTSADVRVPPIATEDWVPQEREVGVASTGPDYGFIGFTTTEWQPPDPDVAVGPDHVVAVVNMRIAVFTKDGTEIFNEYLEDFWGDLGADYFVFDPVAQYDPHADRFVVAAAEHEGGNSMNSRMDIAVSKTSDPTDGWHKYRFTLNHIGGFVDFENLGIGTDAYYITADYFAGGGNQIHIYDKAPMLVGGTGIMDNIQANGGFQSLAAVDHMDNSASVQYFGTSYSGSSTRLKLTALRNSLTNPTLVNYNLPVSFFSNPPSAHQLGTSNRLSTVDLRIKHGVYRDGHMYLAHGIGVGSTAMVRWYDIDMNGWPDSGSNPSLVQEGTIDLGSGQHSWFPDISIDDQGDIVIVANRSSSNDYPFISRFVHKAGDPTGTIREEVRLMESNGYHSGGRWGDYAGIDEDPAEPGVFWSMHEYNEGNGTNWRTWIGRVDSDRSLVLDDPGTLVRGSSATFTTHGATPSGNVYVIYSMVGEGSQYVAALDVNIGLTGAQLAGSSVANASGVASYTAPVPSGAPVGPVWIQTLENRNTSNVHAGSIN